MARLYLIRHGEPSGTWEDSHDPGLTVLGRSQAQVAPDRLRLLQPKQLVPNPLRRAAEIPTPANMNLEHRGDWLRAIMSRTWNEAAPDLRQWRDGVVDYLTRLQADSAVYSHFVAINVALGASIGDDRVTCFRPAHASVTVLETSGRGLSLVELGAVAETTVR